MKRSKKGSTLVELCIVLAVSAVILAMVASFSSLVYYRTVVDSSRQNALAELSDVRTEISEWIMKNDKNSSVIKEAAVPEEGSPDYVKRLRVTYSETDEKVLYFSTSAKALEQDDLAGSEPEQIKSYTNIDGLSFRVIQQEQDGCRAIVECTVTYHIITGKPQTVTFDFTVNAMRKGVSGDES